MRFQLIIRFYLAMICYIIVYIYIIITLYIIYYNIILYSHTYMYNIYTPFCFNMHWKWVDSCRLLYNCLYRRMKIFTSPRLFWTRCTSSSRECTWCARSPPPTPQPTVSQTSRRSSFAASCSQRPSSPRSPPTKTSWWELRH